VRRGVFENALACLTLAIVGGALFAQAPSSPATVDLTSTSLQFHATLPQNNPPTTNFDLVNDLSRLQGDATAKGISSGTLVVTVIDESPLATPAQLTAMYQKMACGADAIVTGHPAASMAHLTASRENIYTDYDFVVDQIIKNNTAAPLSVSKHVVITRPGGSLQLGTGTLKTVNSRPDRYPALQSNREYLIFLGYISASGGYQPYGADATLILNNGQWTFARKIFSSVVLADFADGPLQESLANWLSLCSD
jgi:hypothetical protein